MKPTKFSLLISRSWNAELFLSVSGRVEPDILDIKRHKHFLQGLIQK